MKLGIIMDPIGSIKIEKDSTFAMMLEGQARGHELYYMELADLYLDQDQVCARMRRLTVRDDPAHWFQFNRDSTENLNTLDCILMRKDPPFNLSYLYATQLLELAEKQGVRIVNRPQALRDANEKLFIAWFAACMPPTLVSNNASRLKRFILSHGDCILKPLDAMGGESIFRVQTGDPNTSVIIETITRHGQDFIMAQRFIEAISEGDKRILLINGEPVPYALARIPAAGETRGNLAAGGTGKGIALSARDREICDQVAPTLVKKGLLFVGLDVIGDYLTEINVTSPTCIRELDRLYQLNISGQLFDAIEAL